jgi:ABC-type transport system involved in multi-copper enzyme maturation permease subunit
MAARIGLGPVFAFEWLTGARRWQVYAIRSLFVAGLLAGLLVVWLAEVSGRNLATLRAQAAVGASFYDAIVTTQLALILLAAPAATAGSICVDKARGTLTHLLVTDLADAEIVLGKLAARLIPVVGLIGATLPVLALGTLLGGIDPVALAGAFVVAIGTGVFACSLALLLSVWGNKTHEVLMVTYVVLLVWVLGGPSLWVWRNVSGSGVALPEWFTASNPFWLALAPYTQPGSVGPWDYGVFIAATCGLSAVMAAVATVRCRAVAARQSGRVATAGRWRYLLDRPRGWTWLPGPALDPNPVLWREWHRNRPSRWLRVVWSLYALATIACGVITLEAALNSSGRMRLEFSSILIGGEVAVGLLLLCVQAPSALAEERVRGSLDVLMATPLATSSIIWGKWWGTFRIVPWIAAMPVLSVMAMALRTGTWVIVPIELALIVAYGAAFTSMGLGLATWIPRHGRAVAWSVTIYMLITLGWFFLIVMLTMHTAGVTGPSLASASPFIGSIFICIQVHRPQDHEWSEAVIALLFWTCAYFGTAVILLAAIHASFDRALGRMSALPFSGRPRQAPAFARAPRAPVAVSSPLS